MPRLPKRYTDRIPLHLGRGVQAEIKKQLWAEYLAEEEDKTPKEAQ